MTISSTGLSRERGRRGFLEKDHPYFCLAGGEVPEAPIWGRLSKRAETSKSEVWIYGDK
jgi:hypothetical protein